MSAGASRSEREERRGEKKRREAEGFSFSGVLSRKVRGFGLILVFFFSGQKGGGAQRKKSGSPEVSCSSGP